MTALLGPLGLLAPLLLLASTRAHLTCDDHPSPPSNPVLVSSWHFSPSPAYQSLYHPRHTAQRFAPFSNSSSRKYFSLDMFWATKGTARTSRYVSLHLHRPALVYMLLPYYSATSPRPTLPAWRFEDFVFLADGALTLPYGVHHNASRFMPSRAAVFSRRFADVAHLPHHAWIRAHARGVRPKGDFLALLAEADGTPSSPPHAPPGVPPIAPNKQCPQPLHDLWLAENEHSDDADTRGKTWQTWHPMWDPCYFCAYDHDHGSAAPQLMGYRPRYGYTAWKNGREKESNQGFKSVVFRFRDVFVYYSVHVQTSKLRRVNEPRHTIALAIVNATSRELLVDITHKGDFGFLAAKARPAGFLPLSESDRSLRDRQYDQNLSPRRRTVNVIDVDNLDKRLSFQNGKKLLLGRYEEWTTQPLCTGGGGLYGGGGITFDIATPSTAVKSMRELGVRVPLGHYEDGRFVRSTAQRRVLTVRHFTIGHQYCTAQLGDTRPASRSPPGVFYTDPYGESLKDGSGKKHVRQYFKPGFSIALDGKYEALDSWLQLYERDHLSVVKNFGFGLNPDEN